MWLSLRPLLFTLDPFYCPLTLSFSLHPLTHERAYCTSRSDTSGLAGGASSPAKGIVPYDLSQVNRGSGNTIPGNWY